MDPASSERSRFREALVDASVVAAEIFDHESLVADSSVSRRGLNAGTKPQRLPTSL
jgi:hypothetical protein